MQEIDEADSQAKEAEAESIGSDLKNISPANVSRVKSAIEFLSVHPLAAGILAALGIFGLVLSIVGFGVDRLESDQTDKTVQRVEQKIDQIVEQAIEQKIRSAHPVRSCDDRNVYLDVMQIAREMRLPSLSWRIRGSEGDQEFVSPGVCTMTLLFNTGEPGGHLSGLEVTYTTREPVSVIGAHTYKAMEYDCSSILFSNGPDAAIFGGTAIVGGVVEADDFDCFNFDVGVGQIVTLDVGPQKQRMVATVLGVGDASGSFEFTATKSSYQFRVFQLFRSVGKAKYYFTLSVK